MADIRDYKIEVIIGIFLLGGVMAWLIIPVVFSADTIILVNPDTGGGPISCLPSGALVLAQNLTDLCDVTIISPTTGEIIQYNGSQWINVSSAAFNDTVTCTNLDSGIIICPSYAGDNINLRSFIDGNGISITNTTDTIIITNTGVLSVNSGSGISVNQTTGNVLITNTAQDNTVCANVGTGSQIYKDGECNFRTLGHGVGITLINGTDVITITNTAPESTTCTNQITGIGLCINNDIDLKNFLNGTGISVTTNSTHVTFTNAGVISNSCLIGINCSGTNPSIFNTDFVNGTGISITGTTSQTFTNTGVISNSCTTGVNCSGTNPSVILTDFANGTGISITGTAPQTFTNTGVTSNTATSPIVVSSATGTVNISCPTCITDSSGFAKWEQLCQTSLGSSNATIKCSFTPKRNLFIQMQLRFGGVSNEPAWRFNDDSGNNYSFRISSGGGADTTVVSTSRCNVGTNGALALSGDSDLITFSVYNNQAGDRKLVVGQAVGGGITGSATAPGKFEDTCKWDNTSAQISSITVIAFSGVTPSFNTGSVVTVWGYD